MKQTFLLLVLLAGLAAAQAQQHVPREDALKAAFLLSADLKQMLGTPIPTDPDVKRPVAMREGERGAMVLPEAKLSPEALAKAGQEVVPVGQLWLRGATLQTDGQSPKPESLLPVTLATGDRSATVLLCALGVRKNPEGKLELLIYGKGKEPLLRTPLKPIAGQQENPIEMAGEEQGGGALLTLKILGKHEASFMLLPD
jgi:hypothetical protein